MLEGLFVFSTFVAALTFLRSLVYIATNMAIIASGRSVHTSSISPVVCALAVTYCAWYVFIGGWG